LITCAVALALLLAGCQTPAAPATAVATPTQPSLPTSMPATLVPATPISAVGPATPTATASPAPPAGSPGATDVPATPSFSPTASPARGASQTPLPTQAPASAATPTAGPAAPVPGVVVQEPLLVDSAGGRIYAPASVGPQGRLQTAVLSAQDGRALALYDAAGPLGLDATNGWLYVDRGEQGLSILDARTGAMLKSIALPPLPANTQNAPAPLADPATGRVLAFRDHTVHVIDGRQGQVVQTIDFDLRPQDNCRIPHDAPLPIVGARYDSARQILYADFVSYVCTPWIGFSIVSYDMAAGREIARGGSYLFDVVAAGGYQYGASWHRFGIGFVWAWKDGRPWVETADWSGGPGSALQADSQRRRLYQAAGGNLRVFDTADMRLLMTLPAPAAGRLAGFDSATNRLIFLSDGRLSFVSASILAPAAPAVPPAAAPPANANNLVVPPPRGGQGSPLFGIWGTAMAADDCYVFNQSGGQLYKSVDGGQRWSPLRAGLPAGCALASVLAISPDFERDRTLFAGIVGTGIFKSQDGGASWQPASAGLPSMGITQIAISPGFAGDRTLFASVRTGSLQRSVDGGATWQGLPITPTTFTLSPEFDQDHIAMAMAPNKDYTRSILHVSRDGGERWEPVADAPGPGSPRLLSLAPAFAKWGVLFVYGSDGALYRSPDAGRTWQTVLATGLADNPAAQIAFGPGEERRPVFLLATTFDLAAGPSAVRGKLYRSPDGGQTWQELELPAGVTPTALAISPGFQQDRLLFMGTADGRVLGLDGMQLAGRAP